MSAKITFHGGARSVTGANYLLEFGDVKVLVDCGLFQGSRYAEDLNYEPFPYNASEVAAVFITHSHTDHVGRLPKLFREGFRGKVYATRATIGLVRRALPDNYRLMRQESEQTGREPIFNDEDIDGVMNLAQGQDYGQVIKLSGDVEAVLHDAGHILGSSIIEFRFTGSSGEREKIYFTGDLGNPPTPLLNPPFYPEDADYVVIESAYGSRVHENRDERRDILKQVITDTIKRGGTLMIPSFAMERTQELLYELNNMFEGGEIPQVPVFVDSPLATNLTEVYKENSNFFNKETRYIINSGDDIFHFKGLKFTRTTEESKKINDVPAPKIIIAGSGMSVGGRILHHERRYLPDPNSAILFVGYQVENSLGRKILDGEPEVSIFGEKVPVRCYVEAIGGYSAHADSNMLLAWVKKANTQGKLKKVFIVQGEEESALALARKIKRAMHAMAAIAPRQGDSQEL